MLLSAARRVGASALRLGVQSCRSLAASVPLSEKGAPTSSRGHTYTRDLDAARTHPLPGQLMPVYRVMDAGSKVDPEEDPNLDDTTLVEMYEKMVTLGEMDQTLYKAQRMGLTSFYMMCSGEEGTHFGSASALDPGDMVFGQYREAGVLMWRGYTIDEFMDQCFSNRLDPGKGRQMPVHYGSKKLNFQFISSPLATQMPQAPGHAYGMKLAGSKNCVIVYFGDGAAQEGDAHAAMNFAATLGCPVIFFCRNNAYAISTPVEEQYAGDGIAGRGQGYGMEAIRVDGNDVLAVHKVTKHARDVAVSEHRPVLIEAMTYRLGSHSTSDDQTAYQDMAEVKQWETCHPTLRLRGYLHQRGLWDEEKEAALRGRAQKEIREAMQRARHELKPHLDNLFSHVYDQLPPRLEAQRRELWDLVNKYSKHYPVKHYES